MQAPEVDRELAVDEDPEVVVAREAEDLAATVLELRVELGREAEVVLLAVVALAGVAPPGVVEREEVAALERGDLPVRRELEIDEVRFVHVRSGPVPLVEVRLARHLLPVGA